MNHVLTKHCNKAPRRGHSQFISNSVLDMRLLICKTVEDGNIEFTKELKMIYELKHEVPIGYTVTSKGYILQTNKMRVVARNGVLLSAYPIDHQT